MASSPLGGSQGAQLWVIDGNNQLWSAYQKKPGAQWTDWIGPDWKNSGTQFRAVTVSLQNNKLLELWAADMNGDLWSISQVTSGGSWANAIWIGPGWDLDNN